MLFERVIHSLALMISLIIYNLFIWDLFWFVVELWCFFCISRTWMKWNYISKKAKKLRHAGREDKRRVVARFSYTNVVLCHQSHGLSHASEVPSRSCSYPSHGKRTDAFTAHDSTTSFWSHCLVSFPTSHSPCTLVKKKNWPSRGT